MGVPAAYGSSEWLCLVCASWSQRQCFPPSFRSDGPLQANSNRSCTTFTLKIVPDCSLLGHAFAAVRSLIYSLSASSPSFVHSSQLRVLHNLSFSCALFNRHLLLFFFHRYCFDLCICAIDSNVPPTFLWIPLRHGLPVRLSTDEILRRHYIPPSRRRASTSSVVLSLSGPTTQSFKHSLYICVL